MPWHFEKSGPKLEFRPGPSPEPGSRGWSKTYSSFEAVKGAAASYLGSLIQQLEAKESRDELEERLLERLKTRAVEIEGLTLGDLPPDLLTQDNYDEAYERARYEVEVQRARRRPMAAVVFLAIGLLIIVFTLLKG